MNFVPLRGKTKKLFYLSTNADPTENIYVQRKQKDGRLQDVPCPVIGQLYNKFMFGIDRADQLRMQYSMCRKSKKWWKYLLWFLVDLAIMNSYICMKESPNHKLKTRSGRGNCQDPTEFPNAAESSAYWYFPGVQKEKSYVKCRQWGPMKHTKRGKCKQCAAEKRRHEVFIQCKQCKVFLCIDNGCFEKWHIKNM